MAAQRGLGLVFLIIVAGLVVGSLLGELLGHLLPSGWLQEFFTGGPTIGLTSPATLDMKLVSLTFGFAFKVNVVGVLGIIIAALTFKRI
ncbi:MAG: DUF4321 domain-containing protein [Candidatus Rokubacteria bacterium]|nr:DUF4321 domain-containing protein [Candidatus Rokubacteria bacterium]